MKTAHRASYVAVSGGGALFLASTVHQQKLHEAQDIAEVVLDAEVMLGEMMAKLNGAQGARTDLELQPTNGQKLKTESLKDIGFTHAQAQRLETLAKHPEIVAQAKVEAGRGEPSQDQFYAFPVDVLRHVQAHPSSGATYTLPSMGKPSAAIW